MDHFWDWEPHTYFFLGIGTHFKPFIFLASENFNRRNQFLITLRIYQNTEIRQQNIAMDDLEKNVKTGIIEELYKRNQQDLMNKDERINLLENELMKIKQNELPNMSIDGEVKSLEP